jgi:hypothetical protein
MADGQPSPGSRGSPLLAVTRVCSLAETPKAKRFFALSCQPCAEAQIGQFCRPQVRRLIGYLAVLRATHQLGSPDRADHGRTGPGLLGLAGRAVDCRGQQGDLARRGGE